MSDITGGVDLMALVKGKGMAEPTADEGGFMGDAALDALAQGSWLAHLQPLPAPTDRKVVGAPSGGGQSASDTVDLMRMAHGDDAADGSRTTERHARQSGDSEGSEASASRDGRSDRAGGKDRHKGTDGVSSEGADSRVPRSGRTGSQKLSQKMLPVATVTTLPMDKALLKQLMSSAGGGESVAPASTTPSLPAASVAAVGPVAASAEVSPSTATQGSGTAAGSMATRVAEALRTLQSLGNADGTFRLAEQGLEVKVCLKGSDLIVALRADDASARGAMIAGLEEVRRALESAQLVSGRVIVREEGGEDALGHGGPSSGQEEFVQSRGGDEDGDAFDVHLDSPDKTPRRGRKLNLRA